MGFRSVAGEGSHSFLRPSGFSCCHLGAGFVYLAFPTQSHLQNACNGPASLSDFEFSLDNNAF